MLRFILPTLRSKPLSRKKYLWIDTLGIASIRNRGDPEQRNETKRRKNGGRVEGGAREEQDPLGSRGSSRDLAIVRLH